MFDEQSECFPEVAWTLGESGVRVDVATPGLRDVATSNNGTCSQKHSACGAVGPAHNVACFVDAIGVVNVEASGRSEHSGVAGGFASISVGGFIIRTEVSFHLRDAKADLADGEYAPEELWGDNVGGVGEVDHVASVLDNPVSWMERVR